MKMWGTQPKIQTPWAHPALPASFQPFKSVLQSTYGVKACDPGSRSSCSKSSYNRHLSWARPGRCTWGSVSPFEKKHTTLLYPQGQAQAGDHIGESFKTWKSPKRARQVTLCFLYPPPLSVHLVKPHQSKQGYRRQSTVTEPETREEVLLLIPAPVTLQGAETRFPTVPCANSWPAES